MIEVSTRGGANQERERETGMAATNCDDYTGGMMNRQEAGRLAEEIILNNPDVRLTGFRRYGNRCEIDMEDKHTGIPFVVRSREDWEERKQAAEE